MSYSFTVKGANLAAAVALAQAQFAQVAERQPVHAADLPAVEAAVSGLGEALASDEGHDVAISVSGWVSHTTATDDEPARITAVNASVSLNLIARVEETPTEA